jgi:hypothetical protein
MKKNSSFGYKNVICLLLSALLTNFTKNASARPSIIIWEYQLDVGTSLALY